MQNKSNGYTSMLLKNDNVKTYNLKSSIIFFPHHSKPL